MDKHDQELLDKQLWGFSPHAPRNEGVVGLTILSIFFAGVLIGGILFHHEKLLARKDLVLSPDDQIITNSVTQRRPLKSIETPAARTKTSN